MKLLVMLLYQCLHYLQHPGKNFHQGRHFKFLQDLFLISQQLNSLTNHSVDNLFVEQVLDTWLRLSLSASAAYICPNQHYPFQTNLCFVSEYSFSETPLLGFQILLQLQVFPLLYVSFSSVIIWTILLLDEIHSQGSYFEC